MSWLDDRKTHNMIPHSPIMECGSLFDIASNGEGLLRKKTAMKWRMKKIAY